MNDAFRILLATLVAITILCSLILIALVWVYSLKFFWCVKLPNGSELSYEAFVDFDKSYLIPDIMLRDPDGVIIGKDLAHTCDEYCNLWQRLARA